MDDAKQVPQGVPQTLAVSLDLASGERQQELHVADQVGPAELHQHLALPHVLAVGAEVIAAEHPVAQPGLHQRFRHRSEMDLAAVRAPVGQALMFRHDSRRFGDFHPLEYFRRSPRKDQCAAAVRAAFERVGLEMVDGLRREWRPQMLFVSRLLALLPLLAALGPRPRRFDDVARRRLGGSRGVLAGRGQLLFQLADPGKGLASWAFNVAISASCWARWQAGCLQLGHASGSFAGREDTRRWSLNQDQPNTY